MTPQELLSLLRTLTNTNSTNLPDATGYDFLNIAYKNFREDIVDMGKNYQWDYWLTDLIDDQGYYTFKTPDVTASLS